MEGCPIPILSASPVDVARRQPSYHLVKFLAISLMTAGGLLGISPEIASATPSWGTACYVQTGNAISAGTAVLRCNVTADPSPPTGGTLHYYIVAHMSISTSGITGCSSFNHCGWVSITPGTPVSLSIPGGDHALDVNVFDDNTARTSYSDEINNCSVCHESYLNGSTDFGLTIDDRAADNTIIGVADHAPLAAEQTSPPAPVGTPGNWNTSCADSPDKPSCERLDYSAAQSQDITRYSGWIMGAILFLTVVGVFHRTFGGNS